MPHTLSTLLADAIHQSALGVSATAAVRPLLQRLAEDAGSRYAWLALTAADGNVQLLDWVAPGQSGGRPVPDVLRVRLEDWPRRVRRRRGAAIASAPAVVPGGHGDVVLQVMARGREIGHIALIECPPLQLGGFRRRVQHICDVVGCLIDAERCAQGQIQP